MKQRDLEQLAVAQFRAHIEHDEVHGSVRVQHALDMVWEQHCAGLLTLNEWVDQICSFPAL